MIFEDLGVPPSATAFLGSGRMPEWLAGCFDPAQTLRPTPDWIDVASTIEGEFDSADPSLRGVLALMMAYGRVDECETVLDGISDRCRRMHELLDLALANGIGPAEVDPVRQAVIRIDECYEDEEPGPTRFDRIKAADALYLAGDRTAAVARYRDIAEADASGGEGPHEITRAWAALIADAAEHEGPAAAGALWHAARERNSWFPWPGEGGQVIRRLLGRGVPGILAEAVEIRRTQGAHGWGLKRADREAMAAARAEIDSSGTGR